MASKKTPEINGGSMADISFLMLIFFLMVSTMDPETGLSRRLPPMPPENAQLEDLKVNRRNMLDLSSSLTPTTVLTFLRKLSRTSKALENIRSPKV